MRLFASCLAAIGLQSAVSVSFACEGVVSILRISNYVEGGTESGVRAASDQHNAWYRERGATENLQIVVPMLDYDADADAIVDDTSREGNRHRPRGRGAPTWTYRGRARHGERERRERRAAAAGKAGGASGQRFRV